MKEESNLEMVKINVDGLPPVDLLERKRFAKEIATSLNITFSNGNDSFVFGLNGKWGSGKSTLVHYIKEAIKNDLESKGIQKYALIDFNPWIFSGRDELLSHLLNNISTAVTFGAPKIKRALSILAGRYRTLKDNSFPSTSIDSDDRESEQSDDTESTNLNIEELKNKIDNLIVLSQIRIFVFLDDLDRLFPTEIMEMFQILKLNASFKNTIFILSYDKEVVQEILNLNQGISGEKYLEKIIQVDYRIPDILEEKIHEFFFNYLNDFFATCRIEYEKEEFEIIWSIHRFKFYFNTLRDVHRYFNALKTRLPAIVRDLDIYQFCVVEGIRIFDYKSYESIQRNYKKGIVLGPSTEASQSESRISNETTRFLYQYLFPKYNKQKRRHSIDDPQYFDRYFALVLGKTDVTDETVDRFIRDKESRTYIIQASTADGRIKNLLTSLKDKNMDLGSINPLIRWQVDTEPIFIECKDLFIETLGHILESSGDFTNGLNYLANIIPGDDGHFNPAKFYLLYFLNNINKQGPSIFAKNKAAIKNHSKVFSTALKDNLKRYEHDNLIFDRSVYKTDFFHKLFLMEYRKNHPAEYMARMKAYSDHQNRFFLLLRFIFTPDQPQGHQIDEYWLSHLFNEELINDLRQKSNKIERNGLTPKDKILFDLFMAFKSSLIRTLKSPRIK